MREYILTNIEREILKHYLETGKKKEGFRVLFYRLKKYYPSLESDMNLIHSLMKDVL